MPRRLPIPFPSPDAGTLRNKLPHRCASAFFDANLRVIPILRVGVREWRKRFRGTDCRKRSVVSHTSSYLSGMLNKARIEGPTISSVRKAASQSIFFNSGLFRTDSSASPLRP